MRLSISDQVNTLLFPPDITDIIIQNMGAFDFTFNQDLDGIINFWTVQSLKLSPPVYVKDSPLLNMDSINGNTIIEVLGWG